MHIPFDNSYARLPDRFHARLDPTPVAAPKLVRVNTALAEQLGIDPGELATPEGVAVLAGNGVPPGAEPMALAYAGHQFGHFVPQLGDGRANLLGEVVGRDGVRRDIQLKGSGPTPFSRRGDGRAALGPVLREYLISEAMAALGVPTTRTLAAVTTGETVRRETMLPGAVLTRVAASHIRVGTFQYFAAQGDEDGRPAAGRSRDRPPLSGRRDGREPLPGVPGRGHRPAGGPGGAVAADRLHPWRDEHRQLLDSRRNDRLRPVRLHGRLRPRNGFQFDRPSGPLRLRQPAAHRAVEPHPVGRVPAAAAGRQRRRCERGPFGVRPPLPGGLFRRLAAEDRPADRTGRRRQPDAGPVEADGGGCGGLHADISKTLRRGRRTGR